MQKRRGPSISVKMILTTTAIIVMIVAGFGLANGWRLARAPTSIDASTLARENILPAD